MILRNKTTAVPMIALLCVSVTLMSASAAAGSFSLSAEAENMAVGGGNCSDFLNGFTVGLAFAAFFGCVWCGGAAVASKAVEMFAC